MIFDVLKRLHFTPQEQAVVDYIVLNPEAILHCTAKELSHFSYVSPPTVIRLVKKLGFKGYLEFQLAYAQEYDKVQNKTLPSLSKDSLLFDVMNILPIIYDTVFQETEKLLKKDSFVRVINYALQAKNIDFYANDNNLYLVTTTCQALNALGFHAQSFNTISDHYIASLQPKTAVSFVISHTGNNSIMLDNARCLREKGVYVIAITSFPDSLLASYCQESLYMDVNPYPLPKEVHLYGMSIRYILDILMASISLKLNKDI